LAHGIGVELIDRLSDKKGILNGNVMSGRGGATSSVNEWNEVDILEVVVPSERADEIFNFTYEAAGLDRPHSGFMFLHVVSHAAMFTLPKFATEDYGGAAGTLKRK